MAADAPANANKETVSATIADDTTIASLNTEQLISAAYTLPPAFFNEVGRSLRVSLRALLGTVVTTPGTLTIRVRLGGVAGTLLATTGALALSTAGNAGKDLWIDLDVVTRATGATGTLVAKGRVVNEVSTTANLSSPLTNGATPGVTADLTAIPTQISVTAQFSIADAANTITCNVARYEEGSIRVQRVLA